MMPLMHQRSVGIQRRIEAFESILDAHITINDYERTIAHEIAPSNLYHDTDYCQYVKAHVDVPHACRRFDNGSVPRALKEGHNGLCKHCHGGIYELVVPLRRGSELIGTIAAGPYRTIEGASADPDLTLLSSDEPSVTIDEGLRAQLPAIDAETARTRLELLRSLADTLTARSAESGTVSDADRNRAHRILHIIGRRYPSDYHLSDLASELALSESRAGKVIRELFGKSFTALLQEYRIKKARHYLERTFMPVSEIAHLCGFENENYLYRLFKRFVGTTPLQHRKKHQTTYRV